MGVRSNGSRKRPSRAAPPGLSSTKGPPQRQRPRHALHGPAPVTSAPARRSPIENDERRRRRGEQRQIDPPQPVHPQPLPGQRGGDDQEGEGEGEGVGEMTAQMDEGLELHRWPEGAAKQPRKQLARGLHPALGPAPLLHQERSRRARKLGRNADIVPQDEAPTRDLRPVADSRPRRCLFSARSRGARHSPRSRLRTGARKATPSDQKKWHRAALSPVSSLINRLSRS